MSIVVKNLSQLMKDRNITAYRLTQDLSLSNSAVTDWSKGKASPSRKTLTKLCDYFDVPLSYFYQESELQMMCGLLNAEEQKVVVEFVRNRFPRIK